MVQIGKGAETIFCIAGLSGRDQCMPVYLMHMLKEYVKAWECRWKLENLYDLRVLLEDWKICFIPLLNPDGYEIYEKDFYAIRNPIYRQMLRMQEIPCKEFICNSRGVNLRKNFPTQYYRRKQIHSQPASENETKALVKVSRKIQEEDFCPLATLRDKLFISDNRSHLLQIKKLSPCKTFAKTGRTECR